MSDDFVDQLMEDRKNGELRSPVSETLDMHLVDFGRGEATYEMPAAITTIDISLEGFSATGEESP